MERLRKNSVYVALHGTLCRDLVFRHYTNKVVVARCPEATTVKSLHTLKHRRAKYKAVAQYPQIEMWDPSHAALHLKYLREGNTAYKSALEEHFESQMPKPSIL
jgi:hypothetical protein